LQAKAFISFSVLSVQFLRIRHSGLLCIVGTKISKLFGKSLSHAFSNVHYIGISIAWDEKCQKVFF